MKIHKLINFFLDNILWILAILMSIPIFNLINKRSRELSRAKKRLKKSIDTQMNEPLTLHPEIDPELCSGCGACIKACPEGKILGLINHKAVLVSPTQCVGHGECEIACPMDAIKLVFGTKTRGMDIPRLSSNYETNVPGIYIAGELGGMGLIRNAVKQGTLAALDANQKLNKLTPHDLYDALIVGAGPAGLAAALAFHENNKKYLLIEQNTFGGTVANFPRQKLVMSHPFRLPIFGEIHFPTNKVLKEDLLKIWNNIRQKIKLNIKEQTRFETLTKEDNYFVINTNQGSFKAQKVILATGVRGTPRRLGLPNEDLPKVTYNLIDPDQYKNRDIIVVGGGNAASEAAQMLGRPNLYNRVKLLIRNDNFDRCNEENIRKTKAMEKQGLVEIWFNSTVKEINEKDLLIKRMDNEVRISNDYLFIFAGAELPHKFLMSLGVAIDKKFGEVV